MAFPAHRLQPDSGFTLIELSIVLVIIGLIIGGILTGRDLINAAAIRAQVTQIERYNTAVRTFQNKYGGFPGDLTYSLASRFGFNISGCNGSIGFRNGDGYIDGYWSGGPTYILQGQGEINLFWQDLSAANMLDGAFPQGGAVSTGCAPINNPLSLAQGVDYIGNYYPVAKIGTNNFVYVYDGQSAADSCCGGPNWFAIAAITSVLTNGGMMTTPSLSVLNAYNTDKKLDDGIPNTGNIRATNLNSWWVGWANGEASDSATSCWNWTTNVYSTGINGGNGLRCALSFKMQ